MAGRLTKKEKQFIVELMIDLDQTKAAIRAGYSPNSARQIAAELVKKPKVKEAIEKAMAERSARTGVNADRVVRELARLGFYDPRRLFNFDGSPKDITDLDEDTAAAVVGLEVMEVWEGAGEHREFVGYLKKYKLANKQQALETLIKHVGGIGSKEQREKLKAETELIKEKTKLLKGGVKDTSKLEALIKVVTDDD